MSSKLASFAVRLCSILLVLLGYSCTEMDEDMYGTPLGTFEIKGKVVDENNNAVNEAIIKVTEENEDSSRDYIISGVTNLSGNYSITERYYPIKKLKIVCKPSDSTLLPDSTTIDVDFIKDKNSKSEWDFGHAKATVDFTLKKKPVKE